LPQLTSPFLGLDGDECVVGLMSKHLYEAKEFPLFFWGQRYGLSIVECLFIVPFYALLGVNALAVKLGMLCLWTLGVVFLYKTLQAISIKHTYTPFLLIAIFIWHPAWAVWSMKARGGYLTAFTITNIALYLLLSKNVKKTPLTMCIIGILTVVIFEAQLLWLTGLIPIVCYILAKNKRMSNLFAYLLSSVIIFILFFVYQQEVEVTHNASFVLPGQDGWAERFARMPEYFYQSFKGHYFFGFLKKGDIWSGALSIAYCITLLLLLTHALYLVLRRKAGSGLFLSMITCVPLCLVFTLFFSDVQPRYLLPLSGFMLVCVQLFLNDRNVHSRFFKFPLPILFALGLFSLLGFRQLQFLDGRKKTVNDLVTFCDRENIKYIYTLDLMVGWEIAFISKERIVHHMPGCKSRYPQYSRLVNEAYAEGKNTAVIFPYWLKDTYSASIPLRIDVYAVNKNPLRNMLKNDFCLDK
jgi:hypothetical protein